MTIIGTVALGLGLITVVFTLYNAFFIRVDAVVDRSAWSKFNGLPSAAPARTSRSHELTSRSSAAIRMSSRASLRPTATLPRV